MSLELFAATPEEIYKANCALCHDGGATGAPRLGNGPDWSERRQRGRDALFQSALKGVPNTAMAPRGGAAQLRDVDVLEAVDFMLSRLPRIARKPPPDIKVTVAPRINPGYALRDDALATRVIEALREQRISGVKVEVSGGRVVLSGFVDENAEIRKAEQVARGVPGVRAVENKLISARLFEHD